MLANPRVMHMLRGKLGSVGHDKQVIFGQVRQLEADLIYLLNLIESGTIQVMIDQCYPLEQTRDTHHYVETQGKRGNLVLSNRPS